MLMTELPPEIAVNAPAWLWMDDLALYKKEKCVN
jgi:hypothetical protein